MATLTKNLTISSQGVYSLVMNLIPTGSTVTPVNDIQTWLHCADIWDKNYTTLAQVLADTSTLNSLIQSNNAADYMARSTDWCSNPNLIPKMTSNTTPSGVASAGSAYDSYPAYRAFDRDDTTQWIDTASGSVAGHYLQYKFASSTCVRKLYIKANPTYPIANIYQIDVSNDGNTWTTINSSVHALSNYEATFYITNSTSYLYYRIYFNSSQGPSGNWNASAYTLEMYGKDSSNCVTENQTAMTYIGVNSYCATKLLSNSTWREAICNSAYFEKVLTTKVPTMTSNTTPSGQCFSGGSAVQSGYPEYRAFDKNTTTQYMATSAPFATMYIGYKFASACKILKVTVQGDGECPTVKFQASNTGNTNDWTDVSTAYTLPSNQSATYNLTTNANYTYYRMYITAQGTVNYQWQIWELQFYGR